MEEYRDVIMEASAESDDELLMKYLEEKNYHQKKLLQAL